jgi:hypothetical protein
MTKPTNKDVAARLREFNKNSRFLEYAAIANYSAIHPTELRWGDLDKRSKDDYRMGVRRLLESLAKALDETPEGEQS